MSRTFSSNQNNWQFNQCQPWHPSKLGRYKGHFKMKLMAPARTLDRFLPWEPSSHCGRDLSLDLKKTMSLGSKVGNWQTVTQNNYKSIMQLEQSSSTGSRSEGQPSPPAHSHWSSPTGNAGFWHTLDRSTHPQDWGSELLSWQQHQALKVGKVQRHGKLYQ